MLRQPVLRAAQSAARASRATQTRAASHGPSYNQPSGYLFGDKPGAKAAREGWETPIYLMLASIVGVSVVFAYRPDTSIQTWALEEAKKRMEARGESVEYKPKDA